MGKMIAGVDVGGTYTDLIAIDERSGAVSIAKVPSTPSNQAEGVVAAFNNVTDRLDDFGTIVHGTTVTTNAMLERKISKCGLITTRGFRDTLELGRRTRNTPYGMMAQFVPLIPRNLRLEVTERIDAEGKVVAALDEQGVAAAARRLSELGCESLVIHFLHSYANPAHELRAEEIARTIWPNRYVTVGHKIISEFREYERAVTATVNAAVQPVLERYLTQLQTRLSDRGYKEDLLVMQGNGGLVSSRIVVDSAVSSVLSGPASGVAAAAYSAEAAGVSHVITYDMGGTSCDIGVVKGGVPEVSSDLDLEYAMPVHVPMVEVHTIGAGGGSIAWIDDAGMLQVGPQSAGAVPGPICYGRGGTRVTMSDADLFLGRLNKDKLLAVDKAVSLDAVAHHISEQIGRPLKLAAEKAAAAVLRIGNDKMAGAIRLATLARGHDPRDYTLFAFGGAGPLHAVDVARQLGVPKVLVPARPGLVNALGCIVADVRHDLVDIVNRRLEVVDFDNLASVLKQQIKHGRALIEREVIAIQSVDISHRAHMKYQGQTHELVIPIETVNVDRGWLAAKFSEAYWKRFYVELPEMKPVLVNVQTTIIGRRKRMKLDTLLGFAEKRAASVAAAKTAQRKVWFETGWRDTPIYQRELLPFGASFEGPAIVEQLDSTTVITPGDKVTIDSLGNLLIEI